jgi:diaminohydroxyphosphoribosylaminopyrimidine deaminase/5-amino-6-(5-phosphoribosylamino)uracil reductase
LDYDTRFMEKALEKAFSVVGITSPNPPVGAVIVKDNRVIGCGATSKFGGNHAEINALQNSSSSTSGAHMYVTLEPCCHYGKTPPCTKAIIEAGITRVVIGVIDPNPLVCGRGVSQLKDAGIDVYIDEVYRASSQELLMPFQTYIEKRRPRVIHKAAMTLDGCTASQTGDSKWISSASSRAVSHRLRSLVDAVIIGKGTYQADNPRLDVRENLVNQDSVSRLQNDSYLFSRLIGADFIVQKHSPMRVMVGMPDSFENRELFYDDNYLIVCTERAERCRVPEEISSDKVISLTAKGSEFIHELLQILYSRGVMMVMVEGGARLTTSFFEADVIDSFLYFYAPKVVGGGLPLFFGAGRKLISESKPAHIKGIATVDTDISVYGDLI